MDKPFLSATVECSCAEFIAKFCNLWTQMLIRIGLL